MTGLHLRPRPRRGAPHACGDRLLRSVKGRTGPAVAAGAGEHSAQLGRHRPGAAMAEAKPPSSSTTPGPLRGPLDVEVYAEQAGLTSAELEAIESGASRPSASEVEDILTAANGGTRGRVELYDNHDDVLHIGALADPEKPAQHRRAQADVQPVSPRAAGRSLPAVTEPWKRKPTDIAAVATELETPPWCHRERQLVQFGTDWNDRPERVAWGRLL